MNVTILYSSKAHSEGTFPIVTPRGATLYIRAEDKFALSLSDGLDLATPRPGEVVLNTVPTFDGN